MKNTRIDVPLVTKNELNGIIYKLKQKNKISKKYIIPSASAINQKFSAHRLITWDTYVFQTAAGTETDLPWIQLSFPRGFIYPTAYSMRGTYEKAAARQFATSWYVFGIHEGDENDESKWDLLAMNLSSESTFCNRVWHNGNCNDTRVGTFDLKPLTSYKGYRSLRWRLKTPSNAGSYYFATSGIDVYGTLYFDNIFSCICKRYHNNVYVMTVLCCFLMR